MKKIIYFIYFILFVFGAFCLYKAHICAYTFGYVQNIKRFEIGPDVYEYRADLILGDSIVCKEYTMSETQLGAHQIDRKVKIYYENNKAIAWGIPAFLFCIIPIMLVTGGDVLFFAI
jgi:hypothetical protein